jgi:hypothetical protein
MRRSWQLYSNEKKGLQQAANQSNVWRIRRRMYMVHSFACCIAKSLYIASTNFCISYWVVRKKMSPLLLHHFYISSSCAVSSTVIHKRVPLCTSIAVYILPSVHWKEFTDTPSFVRLLVNRSKCKAYLECVLLYNQQQPSSKYLQRKCIMKTSIEASSFTFSQLSNTGKNSHRQ